MLISNPPSAQVGFDSPSSLLQKKGGEFKSLVDGSGDKKALYAMAEYKAGSSSSGSSPSSNKP